MRKRIGCAGLATGRAPSDLFEHAEANLNSVLEFGHLSPPVDFAPLGHRLIELLGAFKGERELDARVEVIRVEAKPGVERRGALGEVTCEEFGQAPAGRSIAVVRMTCQTTGERGLGRGGVAAQQGMGAVEEGVAVR